MEQLRVEKTVLYSFPDFVFLLKILSLISIVLCHIYKKAKTQESWPAAISDPRDLMKIVLFKNVTTFLTYFWRHLSWHTSSIHKTQRKLYGQLQLEIQEEIQKLLDWWQEIRLQTNQLLPCYAQSHCRERKRTMKCREISFCLHNALSIFLWNIFWKQFYNNIKVENRVLYQCMHAYDPKKQSVLNIFIRKHKRGCAKL